MRLTKKQAADAERDAAELLTRGRKVDRLGALMAHITETIQGLASTTAEADALTAEVASWANAYAPEVPCMFQGLQFVAICSERKNKRTLDKAVFRQLVGDEQFFESAEVALGEYDRLAKSHAGLAGAVATERTGKRTVATHAKGNAVAAKVIPIKVA